MKHMRGHRPSKEASGEERTIDNSTDFGTASRKGQERISTLSRVNPVTCMETPGVDESVPRACCQKSIISVARDFV